MMKNVKMAIKSNGGGGGGVGVSCLNQIDSGICILCTMTSKKNTSAFYIE